MKPKQGLAEIFFTNPHVYVPQKNSIDKYDEIYMHAWGFNYRPEMSSFMRKMQTQLLYPKYLFILILLIVVVMHHHDLAEQFPESLPLMIS